MKGLIVLSFLLIFSVSNAEQRDSKSLNGWTVYSEDKDFDLTKLKVRGVEDRKKVAEKLAKNPRVLYSYDICLGLLEDIIPSFVKEEQEEIQEICHRSLNLEEYVFMAIYRKKIDEKNLSDFRRKMNERFSP